MAPFSILVDSQGKTGYHTRDEKPFDWEAARLRRLATRHDPRNVHRSRFGLGGRFCDDKDEEAVKLAIEEGYPPYPKATQLKQSHAAWLRLLDKQDWSAVSDSLIIEEVLFHSDIFDRSLNRIRDNRQLPQTRACYEKKRDEVLQRILSEMREKLPMHCLPNETMDLTSDDNLMYAIRYYLHNKSTGRVYYRELNEEQYQAHCAYNEKRGLPRPSFDLHRGEVKNLNPAYWQEWLDTESDRLAARKTAWKERDKAILANRLALYKHLQTKDPLEAMAIAAQLRTAHSVAPPATPPSRVVPSNTSSATQTDASELRSPVSVTTGAFSPRIMVTTTLHESTDDSHTGEQSMTVTSTK